MATNPKATGVGTSTFGEDVLGATKALADTGSSLLAPKSKKWGDEQRALQTKYTYTALEYPQSDLGTNKRFPYYMTFYILEQDLSNYHYKGKNKGPAPLSTAAINANQTRTLQRNAKVGDSEIGFGRKTHRSARCIRLYMPETLSWQYTNDWRDVEISGQPFSALAQGLAGATQLISSMAEGIQQSGTSGLLASLQGATSRGTLAPLLEAGAAAVGVDQGLALSAIGIAVNPQVDVIYSSPHLRSFTFQFLFAPRTRKEAVMVADIIKTFKKEAAPEILGEGIGVGRYFVPPSEFDIEFSNVESMGKISSCVLENINVDYAPSGTAFYKDGYPVYTQLVLQFKELEFMTKLHIEKGF